MGYMHIDNLYKNQEILKDKECYALEKIHGTSAHIRWKDGVLSFFSGGENHERFCALFSVPSLTLVLSALKVKDVTIYGEAYGGKQQGMSATYGKELRFVAFDVKVDGRFKDVPVAHSLCVDLGLEFVPYEKIPATVYAIDSERDKISIQGQRNGAPPMPREGVVLRPIIERVDDRGNRVISKHKIALQNECKTNRDVSPEKMIELECAAKIADEWVTENRLSHVIQHMKETVPDVGIEQTGSVIKAMLEDVEREGAGEIVWSEKARKAVSSATAKMFKKSIQDSLYK